MKKIILIAIISLFSLCSFSQISVTPDLKKVLQKGNKTNSLPFKSNNQLSFLKISNDSIELSNDDGLSEISNIKMGGGANVFNSTNSNNITSKQNNFLAPNGNFFTGFISAESGLDAFTTNTLNIGTTYADYIKLGAVTNTLDVKAFKFTHNTGTDNYPNLTASKLLYLDASKNLKNITLGSGLSLSGSTLTASGSTSYSNVKYTDGIAISSTVTAISDTILIPANTFTGNTAFTINVIAERTGTTGANSSIKIYANTTPTITGATQIGSYAGGGGVIFINMVRTLSVRTGTTTCMSTTLSSFTDSQAGQAGLIGTLAIDWTVNQYIIFAVSGAVAEPCKTIFCSVKKL